MWSGGVAAALPSACGRASVPFVSAARRALERLREAGAAGIALRGGAAVLGPRVLVELPDGRRGEHGAVPKP